ncbi:MAG: hypothetical protein K1X89_09170 [Myxococcaceae bacterium]|nr:hypothetical protein [Myxococcaceae bacterium]
MRYQVLTTLPPGTGARTRLAFQLGVMGFQRAVVMRAIAEGVVPQATPSRVAGVLPLLDAVELDGSDWAVYEFFPGATLREVIEVHQSVGRLPSLGLVVRVIVDAARAMHELHAFKDPLDRLAPIKHGGLSDSTLLLGFDGQTRVLDLGARRLSRFIAPEVTRGDRFDVRADVFSLGAVLHAATTGFTKGYAGIVVHAPGPDELPPPSSVHPEATPELDLTVMKALMPDPASRPASLLELAERLELALGPELLTHENVRTALQPLFQARIDALRGIFAAPPSSDLAPVRDRITTVATTVPASVAPAKKPLLPWTMSGEEGAAGNPVLGADLRDLPTNASIQATNPRHGPIPPAARKPAAPEPMSVAEIEELPTDIRPSNPKLSAFDAAPVSLNTGDLLDDADIGGSTEAEKRAAKGQERISTADLDAPEADAVRAKLAEVDTQVKRGSGRHRAPVPEPDLGVAELPTGQTRAPQEAIPTLDEPTHRKAKKTGGHVARRAVLAILVFLVGSGVAVVKLRPDLVDKVRARLDGMAPKAPQPVEVADAGVEEAVDAGQTPDAGDEVADAGQVSDAGEAGDAGAPASDAGSPKKPGKPAKKPKKKR